jgi:hypothetical protein
MPTYQLLTDRTLAHSSAITPTTLIHIVYTGDPSQNLAGSSYKAELGQLAGLFSGSTFSGSTFSGGSGNCIADLYVTNIHGCSPITIYDSIKSSGSTVTNQELAFSYGIRTSATTSASTALNYETRASGIGSLAQGANTWASNTASHAEGAYTIASGVGSHAEGGYNIGSTIYSGGTASGRGSHAEGTFTIASGDGSHAEGVATLASGRGSHAEGGYYDGGIFSGGTAIGRGSHAEGLLTTSEGTGSHAEGRSTLSYGAGSHAEGSGTTSFGQYSHSEGKGSYARGNFQSVVGQFNSTGDTTEGAFMIGNGSDNVNRSNLLFAAGNEVNISGKTKTSTLQITSGATNGYVLTSDASGNASWQASTGGGTFTGGTVSGATNFTNGLTTSTISSTTYLNLPLVSKEVFYKSHSANEALVPLGQFIEPAYYYGTTQVPISGIIPDDFGLYISGDIIIISDISESGDVELNFSAGFIGGVFSATTGFTTFSKTYTQNILDTVNVDMFLSGLSGNQVFCIKIFDNNALNSKLVIGIKYKYYPAPIS